jgi:AcrR family transcriptional regulator
MSMSISIAPPCRTAEYVQGHILNSRRNVAAVPYPADHKARTRHRIVEAARILFNRYGFERVTIDMVMAEAGLTRGGFYAHFESKEALFAAAIDSFLMGRGLRWRNAAGIDPARKDAETARRMVDSYLSREHLADLDGQCPLIALSSDAARAGKDVRECYERLLTAMVWLFEANLGLPGSKSREKALAMAAMLVGGMILARTLPGSTIADEVRASAHRAARAMVPSEVSQ